MYKGEKEQPAIISTKTAFRFTVFTGMLLLFTALIHFLNINETFVAIKTGDIASSYAPSATGMWIFGGMSMLLLGIWLLFLATDIKKGMRKSWLQVVIIGLSLSAFSIGCWLQYPKAFHFLYFLIPGLALLIPCLYYSRRFKNK